MFFFSIEAGVRASVFFLMGFSSYKQTLTDRIYKIPLLLATWAFMFTINREVYFLTFLLI